MCGLKKSDLKIFRNFDFFDFSIENLRFPIVKYQIFKIFEKKNENKKIRPIIFRKPTKNFFWSYIKVFGVDLRHF